MQQWLLTIMSREDVCTLLAFIFLFGCREMVEEGMRDAVFVHYLLGFVYSMVGIFPLLIPIDNM